ncbi:MAG: flavodoxin family protein [ANME-2 cluster archaeon]|nr:flavodoxin family protein [ANME-2 cluster archaeon]MBC2708973.1 flavodoxin family protein [ANME-2 cluster archaeon]MBC2745761.1 flavodoxin family protein [ANME-2 cluster archaeon]MBC2764160.1 flavodoxin family protein [ANME-2 cluster archaeon]
MIKIFGVSGSPRKGSTDYIVNEALKYLEEKYNVETRYFSARGKHLHFCIHCDYCIRERSGCIHKDDMPDFYDGLEWADGIIIGTPVYQGNLSAQTKTMLDRCRAVVAKNPDILRNKVGAALAVGGDRVGGQEIALQSIHHFYIISEMIPVGGGSFGANLGGTFWSQDRMAEGAAEDEEGLRSMRKTMNRMMKMLGVVRGADIPKKG